MNALTTAQITRLIYQHYNKSQAMLIIAIAAIRNMDKDSYERDGRAYLISRIEEAEAIEAIDIEYKLQNN
jgi:hypothetical protein